MVPSLVLCAHLSTHQPCQDRRDLQFVFQVNGLAKADRAQAAVERPRSALNRQSKYSGFMHPGHANCELPM
jgi:hypothetical protein